MDALREVIATIHRLRAPNGCPWDRAQTHQSLRQNLIEEAYEVIDVLDQIETSEELKKTEIKASLREELGDLFMQILLHSEMASEQGAFNIDEVASTLNEKLIRRHPHVFGDQKADSAASALQNWEREKAKEKDKNPLASVLDGVPKALPTLQRATRVLEKVSRVGFQWDELQSPFAKIEEEVREFKEAIQAHEAATQKDSTRSHLEAELGDVLFSLCNMAYLLKLSPEDALRTTLLRFESRFRFVERKIKSQGKKLEESTLAEMDVFWNEAKHEERKKK